MIINRHNYEEFFLLYVDKELEADGRTAVENFVSKNPDLAKELELLQQASLTNENIQFAQKELLYKKENSISLFNYEEYFLLFADNELNEQQATEVENFVLKHPQLQNEFTILQKTRLQPEIIEFAGKEILYRKEKKSRRIIPLTLIRMGAAAAIVGIAYISFIIINTANSSDKNVITASQQPAKTTLEKNDADTAQKSVTQTPVAALDSKKESRNKVKKGGANNTRQQKDDNKKEIKIQNEQVAVDVTNHKSNIQVSEQPKANEETSIKEPALAEVSIVRKNFNDNKIPGLVNPGEKNTLMINDPTVEKDKPLFTHAVYLETDNVEEEKSLYIGSAEINKNKLKGLLKKATVFIEKQIRLNENNDN